jgi:hypothetical protein
MRKESYRSKSRSLKKSARKINRVATSRSTPRGGVRL